jgi:GT2 family glycosyltransferase
VIASTPAPCKIQLVELANGVGPLIVDAAKYRAVGLFFLLHGVPLGHRYLNAAELPLSSAQVWTVAMEAILPALTDYLLRWETPIAALEAECRLQRLAADPLEDFRKGLERRRATGTPGRVSVVICTHERPELLGRCLAALQRFRDEGVEYLVVDNAPKTDATRLVVAEFPNVRYQAEPRPGLSYARNTGIRLAQGDIIAFTDDDVLVTESWLQELVLPFADPAVMSTTGLVIPAEMESREQSLFEHWLTFNRGYAGLRFGPDWLAQFRTSAPVWRIGAGASMAIRRRAFEEIGFFDTRLGAGASGCSEDSELWYRILAAGYCCEYVPSAFVLHYHRNDAASLRGQMRMYARGHATALAIQFGRHRHFGNLYRLGIWLPLFYLRKLAATLVIREWRPFWIASAQGHFAGLFYWARCGRDESGQEASERFATALPAKSGAKANGESIAAFSRRDSHAD